MLISQDLVSTLNIPVSMALGVAPRWVRKNSSCPAVSGMRMTLTCLQSVLLAHPVTPPRVTMTSPDLVYSLKLDNLVSMALEVAPRWVRLWMRRLVRSSCPAVSWMRTWCTVVTDPVLEYVTQLNQVGCGHVWIRSGCWMRPRYSHVVQGLVPQQVGQVPVALVNVVAVVPLLS